MNAAEQYTHYNSQIEAIFALNDKCYSKGLSISFPNDYGLDLARKIMGDLKAKVDAYGDKAYGLSDKQQAVIEKAIEENRAGLERRLAEAEAAEETKIIEEMQAINNGADFDTGAYMPDDLYRAARFVVRGQKTRFEAKEWLAQERAFQDLSAAQAEVFGPDDHMGYRRSTNHTIYAKYEYLKILVWDVIDGRVAS